MVEVKKVNKQLLLLLRVSKPEYNKTLYEDYKLYMNNQFAYKNSGLSQGQFDKKEGMIADNTIRLLYSVDDKKTWKELHGIKSLHKNNNAYIFCMYGITYKEKNYDAKTNTYHHFIPWEYIKDLWKGDKMEMLVVKNTSIFIKKFRESAEASGLSYAFGRVHYDLDEKLSDVTYFDAAMKDSFESVFHKQRNPYEIQNEIRFSVQNPDKPPFYELQLINDGSLLFNSIPLKKGKGIMIELTNMEFNEDKTMPIRFSSSINYYEPLN